MKYEASNGWTVRYRLIPHKDLKTPHYSVTVYDNHGQKFLRALVPHSRPAQMYRQLNAVVYILDQMVKMVPSGKTRDELDQLRYEIWNYTVMLTLHGPTYAGTTQFSPTRRRIR